MEFNKKAFCNKLYSLRISKELSQKDMGKKIGLSQKGYSNIEIGITVPKVDTLFKIATALDVGPETLIVDIQGLSPENQLILDAYKKLLLKNG